MDFRQLELFVAVGEELHFSRAAARVRMAQPPFSQQIRKLEAELGVELLVRTSRRVTLTAAGTQLLHSARDLLARRNDAHALTQRAASGDIGTLRLGFASSSAFGVLPAIISKFRERYPNVVLQVVDKPLCGIGNALSAGDLDVAIVRGPFHHPDVLTERLLKERFVLALPSVHPLARKSAAVPLKALEHEAFVLFPRTQAAELHDTLTHMCRQAGFSPRILHEADSWAAVVSLVDAGLGITIAPASARWLSPAGVAFRELQGARAHTELMLAQPLRGLSQSGVHFKDIALAVAPKAS